MSPINDDEDEFLDFTESKQTLTPGQKNETTEKDEEDAFSGLQKSGS